MLQEIQLEEFDVRSALVVGDHRALIWDTLSHPRDMAPYLPLLEEKEPVVVYSHADWDHVWGTVGLGLDPPPLVIGHQVCSRRFADDVPPTLARKQHDEPGVWDEVRLMPPTMSFSHELTLDLGGVEVLLRSLPGHTPDCLVAFEPDAGILLMGDTVETPFPVVPPDSPLPEWISELERWRHDERVRTVIPAHGPIGSREIIDRTIEYLSCLLAGHAPLVPDELTDFYRETHQANLRWSAPDRA